MPGSRSAGRQGARRATAAACVLVHGVLITRLGLGPHDLGHLARVGGSFSSRRFLRETCSEFTTTGLDARAREPGQTQVEGAQPAPVSAGTGFSRALRGRARTGPDLPAGGGRRAGRNPARCSTNGGSPLLGSRRSVLDALTPQVAVVVLALDLARAVEAQRDRVVLVARSERDRLRRELHDGLGPTSGSARALTPTPQLGAPTPRRRRPNTSSQALDRPHSFRDDLRRCSGSSPCVPVIFGSPVSAGVRGGRLGGDASSGSQRDLTSVLAVLLTSPREGGLMSVAA